MLLAVTGAHAPLSARAGALSPAELDATLCHGLHLQLEQLAERQSQILDRAGAHNSRESTAQSREVEARQTPIREEFSALGCPDVQVVPSRQYYLDALAQRSSGAKTTLAQYLAKHRRSTVALRDFDRLCVIMTRQASKQGVATLELLPSVAKRCEEESVYVPTDDIP